MSEPTPRMIYETHYDQSSDPHWVTRVHHGPYVAYHYIRDAADQLTAMLNELTQARAEIATLTAEVARLKASAEIDWSAMRHH